MKPMFWHVLLEMHHVEEKTESGIYLAQNTVENDALLSSVGRVVDKGPMAYKTKTPAGHDFSVHDEDVVPGAFVLVNRKVGMQIKVKEGNTIRYYQMVSDYEILSVLTEDEAKSIRGYV